MTATGWDALQARLDAAPGTLSFWWRDDDAGRDHPALARLLDLAACHAAPLALATVPAWLDDAATARIAACRWATVIQHGYAHRDHAAPGTRKVELGGRDPGAVLDELRRGRARLAAAFGRRFVPVLVPPWNRIDPELVPRLAGAGYLALSAYDGPFGRAAPGLARLDVHLDPVEWRGHRGFVGEAAALARLIRVLDAAPGPVGVLSHHLATDEPGWRFFDRLLGVLAGHPGGRLAAVGELLEPVTAGAAP